MSNEVVAANTATRDTPKTPLETIARLLQGISCCGTRQATYHSLQQQNTYNNGSLLNICMKAFCLNQQQNRGKKIFRYRPSAWKRIHKHGIEKRLSTINGRLVLFRKLLKGRHRLAVYERFLPGPPPKIKKRDAKVM